MHCDNMMDEQTRWTYPFFMVGTLVTHKYKFKKKRREHIMGLCGTRLHQFVSRFYFGCFYFLDWIFQLKGEESWFVRLAYPSVTCALANTMLSCQTGPAKQCCTVSETTNLLRRLITIVGWTTAWSAQSSANNTVKKKEKKRRARRRQGSAAAR